MIQAEDGHRLRVTIDRHSVGAVDDEHSHRTELFVPVASTLEFVLATVQYRRFLPDVSSELAGLHSWSVTARLDHADHLLAIVSGYCPHLTFFVDRDTPMGALARCEEGTVFLRFDWHGEVRPGDVAADLHGQRARDHR